MQDEVMIDIDNPKDDCISRQAAIKNVAQIAKAVAKSDKQKSLCGRIIFMLEHMEQELKTGWIPVSERLPEEGQIVLVCQIYSWKEFEEGAEVTIAQYKRKHFTWYRYQKDWDKHTSIMTHGDVCPGNEYVTAWMPLPEPYKESEVQDANSD